VFASAVQIFAHDLLQSVLVDGILEGDREQLTSRELAGVVEGEIQVHAVVRSRRDEGKDGLRLPFDGRRRPLQPDALGLAD
jgi:hypothetical protein